MTYAPVDEDQQTRLVNAILDWRDEDDLVHIEGAEKKEYQDAGLNYQPQNKPFQSIEELQLVLGMNETVFKWIEAVSHGLFRTTASYNARGDQRSIAGNPRPGYGLGRFLYCSQIGKRHK